MKAISKPWLLLAILLSLTGCDGGTDKPNPDAGVEERCTLPADPGNCDAYVPAYFHDARTGLCTPFVYGGCGGNENRFADQGDCEAACAGGAPDFGSCSLPSDCMLTSPECCAACDPVDIAAFVAVNHRHAADYAKVIGCEGVACSPCPAVPVEQQTSGYFTATCRAGRCVVLDIRTTPATQCKQNAVDCHLRIGAQCCERCAPPGIIALSSEEELRGFVCDATPAACPPCVPQIPPEFAASCEAGQCRVVQVP